MIETVTAISLADICPRARCGMHLTTAIQEHVVIRQCRCGYEAKEVSGESKLQFSKVKGYAVFAYGAPIK